MGYRLKPNHISSWSRPMKVISDVPVSRNWYKTVSKELSLCHKLIFSDPFIFATWCCRPLIFQTIISVRLNNLSLKNHRFTVTPLSCKDIIIKKFNIVTKTQFLYTKIHIYIQFCIEMVGLNRSYSANMQPIWKQRYPRET